MSIVLSILQIIGWILLIAFVLLLFVVFIVLFCPVRYLLEGEWLDEKWAKAKIHWLLNLFRVKVSYGDDLIYGEIGILWKKKTFSVDLTKKEENAEEDIEEEIGNVTSEIKEVAENTLKEAEEKIIGTETTEELRGKTSETQEDKLETEDLNATDETFADTSEEDQNATDEKVESIISKIKGIIERIREVYGKVKKILSDEKNQAAVAHIKNEIVYLIKILLPKKSKIDAVFSTGSPDTTGQLFGVLACFPAMYYKDWKLLPDFEADEAYFKGSFWGKGRVYGYQIVGIILRNIFDKNCRRLYTIINRFIKWMKKDEKSEVK